MISLWHTLRAVCNEASFTVWNEYLNLKKKKKLSAMTKGKGK